MENVTIRKTPKISGSTLSFPGDKSLSHRAILFGALAEGVSSFTNVLDGEDCVCTRRAFEEMGVKIKARSSTELEIQGAGLRGLKAPKRELYLGNSGTSMRLLSGVAAGQPFETVLTGDPSLSSRPMKRVTEFLKQMGARVEGRENGNYAPLKIRGGDLKAIEARLPVASAQVKSAILLAGLYAQGRTSVTEPGKSRDHTERFLKYFGAKIKEDGLTVSVEGGQALRARSFEIAGDISSAAFFMALAALYPSAGIRFRSVLWNPTRTGVVEVLKRMGVTFDVKVSSSAGPEPTADFTLSAASLRAVEIMPAELPSLIDEIPVLTVLATQARGTTVIHDADELRVKETDRIRSMSETLNQMGARVEVSGNTMRIHGPTPLTGATVDSFKDHRTAMSLVVAGLVASGETRVRDVECVKTSFPVFFDRLSDLGIAFQRSV